MVIALFGESCTGKSTLADALKKEFNAEVYTGRDYLRFAKGEREAREAFRAMLAAAKEPVVYVISEKELLGLLPKNCVRVLVTADLSLIRERFAKRMDGKLPPPVAAMLEKKHGAFDGEPHDLHVRGGEDDSSEALAQIRRLLASRSA